MVTTATLTVSGVAKIVGSGTETNLFPGELDLVDIPLFGGGGSCSGDSDAADQLNSDPLLLEHLARVRRGGGEDCSTNWAARF